MVLLLSFWGTSVSTPCVASVQFPIIYGVDVQIIMINVFMASVGVIEKALSFLYFQSSCWMWLVRKRVRLREQASSSVHVNLEQTLKASLEKYRAEWFDLIDILLRFCLIDILLCVGPKHCWKKWEPDIFHFPFQKHSYFILFHTLITIWTTMFTLIIIAFNAVACW